MQTGISTASLFKRYQTLEALKRLDDNGVKTAEVFLESYSEYNKKFGKKLAKAKGGVEIHSVHTLATQFEPQLYSENQVAQKDSFDILDGVLECAKQIGAKYYTFHGTARIRRVPININFERHAKITNLIAERCLSYGVTLAYENVHWCYYNYVGFFNELKKRVPLLKGTLDVKQARQSGISHLEFLKEMKGDIATVHLSDVDENGKMCLPMAKGGTVDFNELFSALADVGFDGAMLIEAYYGDYKEEAELYDCYQKISELSKKHFK